MRLLQVDLQTRQVETLAGNGQKGSDYMGGGRDRNQQLNSPWDLVLDSEVRDFTQCTTLAHCIGSTTKEPSQGLKSRLQTGCIFTCCSSHLVMTRKHPST